MSTSASQFFESDVDMYNTKKNETDVNIRFTIFWIGCWHPKYKKQKQKKNETDVDIHFTIFWSGCRHPQYKKRKIMKQMSISASQFSKVDVDMHNTKNKQKKWNGCRHLLHNFWSGCWHPQSKKKTKTKMKRMSTSASQISEADVDIRNEKRNIKKLGNGCWHPQYNFLKRMSTSTMYINVNFKYITDNKHSSYNNNDNNNGIWLKWEWILTWKKRALKD